jgi:hypothetical protein
MRCNKKLSKWCKNKHGSSKIIDTFETYQYSTQRFHWELGRTREPIRNKFLLNIQMPSVTGRNQVVRIEERRNSALLYTTLECNQKFYRRRLQRESNRCFFGWPSSFGPRGRGRENKAKDGVGVTPRLLLKAELLCVCAIPWISR